MSTIQANAILDASGGNTVTVNGVTPTSNNVRGRNLIINGAMQVAQRNTSVSGVVNSGYVSLDRYQIDYSGAGAWTISQDSDAPNGFGNSMKFLCTTSDSLDAGADRLAFRQFIEGQNLQQLKKGTADAQQSTVSFWVKSNKTGTYVVELYDHDNARHINKSYTVNSANTWEYKTVTFEADTTGALDNDNALSLHLHFWLAAGSTYSGGTLQTSWGGNTTANRAAGNVNLADTVNNYFNITGIQLEVGSVATEFDHKSFDTELQDCRRYFCKTYNYADAVGSVGSGYWAWTKTTSQRWDIPLYQGHGMRTTPTIVAYNASTGTVGQYRNASNGTNHTVGTFQATQNVLFIDENAGNWNNLGGGSVGRMFVTADAEL